MKRFNYSLIIAIAVICNSYSQEDKRNSKLYINSSIGFATLEISGPFKMNSVSKELFIGLDLFNIKEDIVLYSGFEYTDISGSFSNSEVDTFIKNKNVGALVMIRYLKKGANNLDFFIDAGAYSSYLFQSETLALGQTNSENSIGFNFGLKANIGAAFKFDEIWEFTIGLSTKADFANNTKKDLYEYKITELYAFNIGFLISI